MTSSPERSESAALINRANDIADRVLFPRADRTDRDGKLPIEQLDVIAAEGLYGLVGPTELGGAGADERTRLDVIEAFAGGCMNTTFVWTQHQGAVAATVAASGPVHDTWARRLSSGEAKAGVSFAHLLRPDPLITADRVNDGWLVSGFAPWVTGWGYIDTFLNAARFETEASDGGQVVWAMIDAVDSSTLRSRTLELAAVDASGTFALEFDRHFVPDEQVTSIQSYAQWMSDYPKGLRTNGSLGLGVANRTAKLLGPSGFDEELGRVRSYLDSATVEELPDARGQLGALTVRMTGSLVASLGGKSIMANHPGQRLAREALFLLIQGQTPAIRTAQLDGLR